MPPIVFLVHTDALDLPFMTQAALFALSERMRAPLIRRTDDMQMSTKGEDKNEDNHGSRAEITWLNYHAACASACTRDARTERCWPKECTASVRPGIGSVLTTMRL